MYLVAKDRTDRVQDQIKGLGRGPGLLAFRSAAL